MQTLTGQFYINKKILFALGSQILLFSVHGEIKRG